MILRNCSLAEFTQRVHNKKVFCFGAFVMPVGMCNENPELDLEKIIDYMVDNDPNKHNKDFDLCGHKKKILSAEQLAECADTSSVILITSMYYVSIIEQLNAYSSLINAECYVYPLMKALYSDYEIINPRTEYKQLIPKTIHYFWFGNNPKSELINMCIASWRKFCPDYEIIEWNESNYDVNINRFTSEAYREKKWAFVSDFARLDILYQYGGVYMDTDVELIKPLDEMLYNAAYFGFGNYGRVASGLGFGCVKQHELVKELLDMYDSISFDESKDKNDLITNTMRETAVFEKNGLVQNNKFQIVKNAAVFPSDFFAPMIPGTTKINYTKNTFSVHHNNFSWASKQEMTQYISSITKADEIISEMNKNS